MQIWFPFWWCHEVGPWRVVILLRKKKALLQEVHLFPQPSAYQSRSCLLNSYGEEQEIEAFALHLASSLLCGCSPTFTTLCGVHFPGLSTKSVWVQCSDLLKVQDFVLQKALRLWLRGPEFGLLILMEIEHSLPGNEMTHGLDFTVALILNSLQRKCHPVLTENCEPGLGSPLTQGCVTLSTGNSHF